MGICQKARKSYKTATVAPKVASRTAERIHERAGQDADFAYLAQRVDVLEARVELFWQRIQQQNIAAAQQNGAAN